LKNSPGRIAKLKKAIAENSTSVIPRYLLGREYRLEGQPEKCIEVLDPVIKTKFGEFRSFVEYVRAMLDLGESYSKCTALLSQARLDGMTDPAFVGLLGGLLVMDQKFAEAKRTFDESIRQSFTFEEKTRVQFRPRDHATKGVLQLLGRVASVKPGFVFVQNESYADFFSRITRVGNTVLQRGMALRFQPAFTARGAIADHIELTAAG
jgi:hypothetical protein